MKWMSSLATCLETVIDRLCWQNSWRSENSFQSEFPACQSAETFLMIFSVDGIMFKSVTKEMWHRSSQNLSTSLWKGWGTNLTITCWDSKSSQTHHNHLFTFIRLSLKKWKQPTCVSITINKNYQCPNREAPTLWRSAPLCAEPRPHVSAKLSWTWKSGICTRHAHLSSEKYVILSESCTKFCSSTTNHPKKSMTLPQSAATN